MKLDIQKPDLHFFLPAGVIESAEKEAPASVFWYVLAFRHGAEAFNWEPETLWAELKEVGFTPNRAQKDAMLAMQTAIVTDVFTKDTQAFIHICNALGGEGADFNTWDPATLEEIAVTIAELQLFADDIFDFSEDVLGYVAAEAQMEGVSAFPKILAAFRGAESPNSFIQPGGSATVDPVWMQTMLTVQAEKSQELQDAANARLLDVAKRLEYMNLVGKPEETIRGYVAQFSPKTS